MRRIRLLRVLLPALLFPFLLALVWQIRSRPALRSDPVPERPRVGPRAEGIDFTELFGETRQLSVRARIGEQDPDGAYRLEGVERIEVEREGAPPLVLQAGQGELDGPPGRRKVRLEGGVELRDAAADLLLVLPSLEVDEAAGQARSVGELRIQTQRWEGRAASVVYGLREAPTEIFDLELGDGPGTKLRASRAVLRDGARDVELRGAVRGGMGGSEITAESLRIFRPDGKRLRRALAEGAVAGRFAPGGGPILRFRAGRLEAEWDEEGRPWRFALEEDAEIEQAGTRLEAERIEGRASSDAGTWEVDAERALRVTGDLGGKEVLLGAERLHVILAESGSFRRAEAQGNVRFDGAAGSGEAARLVFDASSGRGRTTLEGEGWVRARWARDRMRVAGDRLMTDSTGTALDAEGRVEASLLPDEAGPKAGERPGIFSDGEAVHFVAARLSADGSGRRLKFSGDVRGWQGDRNLSANSVQLDRDADTLQADGRVSVRIPREGQATSSAVDYLHVSAERLAYAGARAQAVFEGNVRSRQEEGWLDASRMEVDLHRERGGVRQVRASGGVRFELRSATSGQASVTATGEGDRAHYDPGAGFVRLFGDKVPASVHRSGAAGGTVTGRVLRYRLRDGSLEVESGERNRARVRGSRS